VIYLLLALGAAAAAYQLLALVAAVLRLAARERRASAFPPVSILKPVHGFDPGFYESIRSHALVDYPEYEILFGASDPDDPAIAEVERLIKEYPALPIRFVSGAAPAGNRKVGVLERLAAEARYALLVVNDSDIRVPRDYLKRIVAPLEDAAVGMVTCLYRARASRLPGRFEAVGIATDFTPGVLVAPLVGVSEFALGSTLAFRARDLERAGGFAAIADYIADDYQLSKHIRELGLRVTISKCVVETSVPDSTWGDMWRHQLRWARTIRLSRGGGYLGLPVTNATFWAALLAVAGAWWAALPLFALRMVCGLVTAVFVLGDKRSLAGAILIPFRDLAGLALWLAGLFGSSVVWRDATLRLDRAGRIVRGPGRELDIRAETR
jgi:ceramide glucosyltransferase